ncbi:MAG: bifunctional (p)ppGpp synthetase/guanosine-3',5'-bis(diphosphate) 3'-pyrophosphohydrolase [Candidatus Obscuribacterales bacterium]
MTQTFEKPLIKLLEDQGRDPADVKQVQKAYDFAHKAHDGQLRKSEDPYIIHPVEVSMILAELDADVQTLCAALLHDVLEDCDVTPKQMEKEFGSDIVTIVEGVTKLGKFSFSSKEERQAENFRKLIVAIAEDFRVVLVKMADRLHNMRTMDHMSPHKQVEISKETLEIYAPLANRFGLGEMKWELEDLALRYVQPEEFAELQKLISESREEREILLQQVIDKLAEELKNRGINADIVGRPKHLFGVWLKMKKQQKSFEELYDVHAIRIIIDSSRDKNFCEIGKDPDTQKCYEVMGIVHNIFTPIPGRFKDYIAMPKFNNYQSLHTAVIGAKGKPVEIQIRTRRMHHVAEYGIAAHWRYKESGSSTKADSSTDRKLAWLRQLVDWRQDLADAQEYMEEVKIDLFSDQVFVFSPRGDVMDLPTGSTPIDFAYRIHTAVGHKCAGAKINDRIMPLNTVLKNGDIVEIITTKVLQPKMDWLNFAKTHGAKSKIRLWFKKHHRDEHIQQGRQMLESELGRASLDDFLKSDKVAEVGRKLNLKKAEDLLAAVGYGDITVSQVVHRLREMEKQEEIEKKGYMLPAAQETKAKDIGSLGGLLHHLAKCCQPVPGEEIVGVVTRGSGIAVHRSDCSNMLQVDEARRMSVDWSTERNTTYPACLLVECLDRVGIAGDILKKVSDNKVNLRDLRVETKKEKKAAVIMLILEVSDISQHTQVSQSISQISDDIRVHRKDHRKKGAKGAPPPASNVTPLKAPQKSNEKGKSEPRAQSAD